ncbi:hypothetical protein JTB14_006179 [Gonioctena quinquepunctata]|nr:hypothetical protein JTB14_006179 [Gonioctena quinquepunctata]
MRAESERVLKQSKRESWNKFTSTITSDTSPSQIWTKIRQMKRKNTSFGISGSTHVGQVITNDQRIANILAQHFQNKTKPNPKPPNTTNNSQPKQTPYNCHSLNLPFTPSELNSVLLSLKNTAAGPDDIPMIFLK